MRCDTSKNSVRLSCVVIGVCGMFCILCSMMVFYSCGSAAVGYVFTVANRWQQDTLLVLSNFAGPC